MTSSYRPDPYFSILPYIPFRGATLGGIPNLNSYDLLRKTRTELRVTIHPGVTQGLFNQILPHFSYLHPHIKVKVNPYLSVNKKLDLNFKNTDIFIGPWDHTKEEMLPHLNAVIHPLFTYSLRFFASKTYTDKPDRSETIHNLTRHPILGVKYSDLLNKPDCWHLLRAPEPDSDSPVLMTIDHISNFMLAQDGLAVVPWAGEGIFWSPIEMVPVFSGILSTPIPVSFIVLGNSPLDHEISTLYKMLKETILHYQLSKGNA
jgi:DNA-binding transcriptional LysR family regulator